MLIDVVRGIAISLVALGHTNQGLMHRQWWGNSTIGTRLDMAIYAFHMPAFFFVSGVFLRAGVDKRGKKHYTLEKLRTVLYPYVLWVSIFAASVTPLARFTPQRFPGWKVFFLGLVTGNISWFLPTLFFLLMIGMLTRRIPAPVLFVLSVIIYMLFPFNPYVAFLERGVENLTFLVAGIWMGNSYKHMQRIPITVSAVCAAACAVVIVMMTAQPRFGATPVFLFLGLLGTLMLMLVARCLGQSASARTLAWIGAASFGIFLMSSLPQLAGREVLARIFHTTSPLPQLIFPTLLAIFVPAWLYHYRIRLHIQWMFRSPL
jgi:fucose 4-O-acetylase-like acetyltransferase